MNEQRAMWAIVVAWRPKDPRRRWEVLQGSLQHVSGVLLNHCYVGAVEIWFMELCKTSTWMTDECERM
jgi:hypothetical protein